MPAFGQIVVGPPGSGKTTYCAGMSAYLNVVGRPCAVINLDPANDDLRYDCAVDVAELCALEEVMAQLDLGPNGGLVYCMEFLAANADWLVAKLASNGGPLDKASGKDDYLLIDCPGQVELFTHNDALKGLLRLLEERLDLRLVVVHLVDSHHCTDAATYISASMLSLSTMLQLELPHINVLSKIDNLECYGTLAFHKGFYADTSGLERLVPYVGTQPMKEGGSGEAGLAAQLSAAGAAGVADTNAGTNGGDDKRRAGALGLARYQKLNGMLCDLVQQFSIVSFLTLNVMDPDSMCTVLQATDKAIGYVQKSKERKAKLGDTTYLDEFRSAMPNVESEPSGL